MRKRLWTLGFLMALSLAPARAGFANSGIDPRYLMAAQYGVPYGADPRLGQMQMVDMRAVYMGMAINWGGAQPMGFSYLPPMGLSAFGADSMHSQLTRQMVGMGY